ncbi:MAG TPA: 4-alpha-glucanotransferase [Candidatus Baltobacteraceae bacterium]|nr:4-alpha-glucanotransferase [Candidatus Baltobacteraceae bacterium]
MNEPRVEREYVDALGERKVAAPETVERLESLIGPRPRGLAPPTVVVRENEPLSVDLTLPASSASNAAVRWTLNPERGSAMRGEAAFGDAPLVASETHERGAVETRRVRIADPRPLGVYRLDIEASARGEREPARARVHVLVVPRAAHAPCDRTWGIALQVYELRSSRNDGIGDFADLRTVCALLGDRGASYVGINPLHAPFRSDPEDASPYAASSRRWLNWLAIAVDDVAESRDPKVRALLDRRDRRARIDALRATRHVDYTGVAAAKDDALRACYAALPRAPERRASFEDWCGRQGEPLRRFAAFEVLAARYGRTIERWPAEYHNADGPAVKRLAERDAAELRYAMYLQWLAAEQLAAVAEEAARHGVRLYRDLAVGVDRNSADVWADAEAYVEDVSIGAPPDELNALGQDWGLPPLDPRGLVREGYAELLEVTQANCRHAGALRLDHAFALQRLYWIPRGDGPRLGAYVSYPLDELRGIVALASARERCVLVGEDLGTVPPGFRETMAATGILSYRILFFEREPDGAFVAPERYPPLALAASGTHDLPTIAAWLHGEDVALRERFGMLRGSAAEERAARERERTMLLDTLVAHGDLRPAERDDETAVAIAVNRFLAAAPSAIVMAQLDDILGEREPTNVPGTSTQYPNWRRKLGTEIEALPNDPRLGRLCNAFNELRPRATAR